MEKKNTITVEKHKAYFKFGGPLHLLRKIIFHTQDLIWPEWCENEKGRKTVLGYVDQAEKNGSISIGRRMFLDDQKYMKVIGRLVNEMEVVIKESDADPDNDGIPDGIASGAKPPSE